MRGVIKISLLLFVIFGVVSCGGATSSTTQSTKRVKCQEVQSFTDKPSNSLYPAKVVAASDVNLSFRIAGIIERIAVEEGDFVKKGSVIAIMDNRDYKLQLDATQAEFNAIEAEAKRVISLYESQSVTQNDYDKATSALEQITAKLEAHRNAYEDTQLRAPFSGYIQKINFRQGEAVSAGRAVVSFIDASSPEVIVNIPVVEYLRRDNLLSASASISNIEQGDFELNLIGITHKANLNQLYQARFRVVSNDGVYPPLGVSAMVSLEFNQEDSDLTIIPASALVEHNGESSVWLIEGNQAQLRGVTIEELRGDGRVVIKSGLTPGEMVITAGVSRLKSAERVEPLERPSKSNVGNIL
ncbi:MAG: efflux RND transporter periplasmic adaptor subunit [Rikenellaceae bacterium]